MNKWWLFEMLKGNREMDISLIESMPSEEVKEALIEYLLDKNHDDQN